MSVVIFDPKYRAGASLLDGLRDMHVYRDAIVDSDGARLVRAVAPVAAPRRTKAAALPLSAAEAWQEHADLARG